MSPIRGASLSLGLLFSPATVHDIGLFPRLGHGLQAASQGAGRGELLGFQGVSEAYRGDSRPGTADSQLT